MGAAKPLWARQDRNPRGLLGRARLVEFTVEDEPSVERALFLWKNSSAEFADCLIGARHVALGCRATASFDARALKLPGFVPA